MSLCSDDRPRHVDGQLKASSTPGVNLDSTRVQPNDIYELPASFHHPNHRLTAGRQSIDTHDDQYQHSQSHGEQDQYPYDKQGQYLYDEQGQYPHDDPHKDPQRDQHENPPAGDKLKDQSEVFPIDIQSWQQLQHQREICRSEDKSTESLAQLESVGYNLEDKSEEQLIVDQSMQLEHQIKYQLDLQIRMIKDKSEHQNKAQSGFQIENKSELQMQNVSDQCWRSLLENQPVEHQMQDQALEYLLQSRLERQQLRGQSSGHQIQDQSTKHQIQYTSTNMTAKTAQNPTTQHEMQVESAGGQTENQDKMVVLTTGQSLLSQATKAQSVTGLIHQLRPLVRVPGTQPKTLMDRKIIVMQHLPSLSVMTKRVEQVCTSQQEPEKMNQSIAQKRSSIDANYSHEQPLSDPEIIGRTGSKVRTFTGFA